MRPDEAQPTDVIVNPYGAAYPSAPALTSALRGGAAWVNLAGVPFLEPDGHTDADAPGRFGVFAPRTPSAWFSGSTRTELGAALLPELPEQSSDHSGWVVHAARPDDERTLAEYHDAEGISGGPAVTVIVRPYRIVAIGYVGNASPLNPTRTGAPQLLAGLVRVALTSTPLITGATVTHSGTSVRVTASGNGRLTGIGEFSAPSPWSPEHPSTTFATIRLYKANKLIDLRRIPLNSASVSVRGRDLLVDGAPFIVKGMEAEDSYFAPGMCPMDQAATLRADFARMHAVGVNALRAYDYQSDWSINAASRHGLFVMDALPFGTLTPAAVASALPWAQFIGARGRETPNLLIFSLGNETQDGGFGDPAVVQSQLAQLAAAIRSTDARTHPVTYAASEDEPWVLGPLPFLDVYGYNNYGATYPVAQDSSGFLLAQTIAQTIAGDRPMLITELGVNSTPTAQATLVMGADTPVYGDVQAAALYRKWSTLRSAGAIGGYYFEWSDKTVSSFPLPVPAYDQTLGAIEYPAGSGYHPANEENFWGLHDIYRRPRPTLAGLRYSYTGQGPAPLPIPAP
jgi:hypothetical protein